MSGCRRLSHEARLGQLPRSERCRGEGYWYRMSESWRRMSESHQSRLDRLLPRERCRRAGDWRRAGCPGSTPSKDRATTKSAPFWRVRGMKREDVNKIMDGGATPSFIVCKRGLAVVLVLVPMRPSERCRGAGCWCRMSESYQSYLGQPPPSSERFRGAGNWHRVFESHQIVSAWPTAAK